MKTRYESLDLWWRVSEKERFMRWVNSLRLGRRTDRVEFLWLEKDDAR